MPNVHQFASTSDAYDWSQVGEHPETGAKIDDGDVLVVASEGIIGILFAAWPAAIVMPEDGLGQFHGLSEDAYASEIVGGHSYEESFKLARDTAHSDADITGNEHWSKA